MTTPNNLTVNHVIPENRKTGEVTFTVVDPEKRAAIAFYPASQLENGAKSTPEQVLNHFQTDLKPAVTIA